MTQLQSPSQLPVLIMGFRRPDSLGQVIDALRLVRPRHVYTSLDGPRENNADDKKKRAEVESVIDSKIDWPCEIKKRYNENNLGSAPHIVSAINWFFSMVESGIILEDDCVPDPTFFPFAQELLEKYSSDTRVMAINGSSLVGGDDTENSYRSSRYFSSWGWATWRRSWNLYQDKVTDSEVLLKNLTSDETYNFKKKELKFWTKFLVGFENGKYPFWDGRWNYTIWKNKGVCLTPNSNLIVNVGFTSDATHTFSKDKFIPTKTEPINTIKHPERLIINDVKDYALFEALYYRNFYQKVSFKIQLLIFKMWKKTSI